MSRFLALGVLVTLAVLLLAPTTSPACACGPEPRFLVAHGTSPHGAPWQIRAEEFPASRTSPRGALLHFSTGHPGETNGLGHYSGFGLPIPRGFVFRATSGDGLYPELEGDVSGFARPRAVRLIAEMTDGSSIEVETQRASARLAERFPWLRGLVFFNQFYAAEIEVLAITAYGRYGRVLARQPL